MLKKIHSISAVIILLLFPQITTAEKILFYEVGTPPKYQIEKGYSKFAQELRNKGHIVASITKGTITKEKLEAYDILVLQAVQKPVKAEELSAILWFVLQKGSGLFINGATPNSNQLTVPFGITVDSGLLIDTNDPLESEEYSNNINMFIINHFPDDPITRTLRQGVTRIGFYKGNGIFLSTNAHRLACGDEDTYTDTGSFPTGSEPCVSAAVLFGRGMVVLHTDPNFLTNDHIGEYNNLKYGLNIIDWLSIKRNVEDIGENTDCSVLIGMYKLENTRLKTENKKLRKERDSLASANLDLTAKINELTSQQSGLKKIGPFTSTQAMILGAMVLVIFILLIKKRKAKEVSKEKEAPEEEIGYEIEAPESPEKEKKGEEGEEEIDIKSVLESDLMEE